MKRILAVLAVIALPLAARAAPGVDAHVDTMSWDETPANVVLVHPDWSTLSGVGVTWIRQVSPNWALHVEGNVGGRSVTLRGMNGAPAMGSTMRDIGGELVLGADLFPLGGAQGGPLLGARIGGGLNRWTNQLEGAGAEGPRYDTSEWMGHVGGRAGYLARFDFGLALQAAVGFDAGYSQTKHTFTQPGETNPPMSSSMSWMVPALELGVGWAF